MITGSNAPKVLIVGAGPTGLTLGINLLRGGVPCRVIDKLPGRLPWSRALGLHARSQEIFDAMGVLDAVRDQARAFEAIHVYGDKGRDKGALLSLPMGGLPSPFPRLLCCPQPRIEAVLEERFRSLGGELWWDTELIDFQQDGSGVQARVLQRNEERQLQADLMVGTDGAHSRVRQLLGLPFVGNDYHERFLLADVDWSPDLENDAFHGFLLADGNLIAIPMPDDGWRLVVTEEPGEESSEGEDGEQDDAAEPDMALFHARIREALGDQAPLPGEPRWLSRFTIQRRLVSHYRRNRILLAGDACHVQSPLGAQGMNTGIADAFNLVWPGNWCCSAAGTAAARCWTAISASGGRWRRTCCAAWTPCRGPRSCAPRCCAAPAIRCCAWPVTARNWAGVWCAAPANWTCITGIHRWSTPGPTPISAGATRGHCPATGCRTPACGRNATARRAGCRRCCVSRCTICCSSWAANRITAPA